ncbi:MAG: tRNA-t(6)A37 methylthiotransferase [Ignavibacteriae bacterium]|nr:MAG: tRNA-t(6)A37 methylthiotransferase [Ignavibacteriota bacterium]
MKKASFYTLGCKLNFAETSTIARTFAENGFLITKFEDKSDVYIVNTCTVSQRADKECRKIIRSIIRRSPDAYIIVTGCYAQLRPEEIASIEGVDLVLGTKEKFQIQNFLSSLDKKKSPQIYVSELSDSNDFGIAYSGDVDDRTRAFLKIQDGCDFHCSFCTIPLARGESRSQPIDSIINQAKYLSEKGFKEIVLSGVNVGDYGKKIGENLLNLLEKLVQIHGIERIRISSIEPNLLSNELINFILQNEKLCNHFHIPLQSGSDEILKLMRRRYKVEDYKKLVEYIKTKDPDAAIGADVIVGFPGETEMHFQETYKFLLDLPISYLHVFTYSERPNTPAAQSQNQIEPRIRFERNRKLRLLGKKKKLNFYSKFLTQFIPVLFESNHDDGYMYGFTRNYIRVRVDYDESLVNKIVPVKIISVDDDVCLGNYLYEP